MWIAEFKVWHEGSTTLQIASDLDVKIANYYLNSYVEGGKEYIFKVSVALGEKRAEFMQRMRQDKRMQIIRIENDQVYYRIPAIRAFHHVVLDKTLFFIKPIIAKKGFEYWTVASPEKKALTGLVLKLSKLKEKAKIELLSLKERPLNFFVPALFTDMTDMQKKAIEIAYQNGYYSHPRKMNVKDLAKLMHVPRSTYQEHLRKAESKLVNSAFGRI